jgi:hypothetical protein
MTKYYIKQELIQVEYKNLDVLIVVKIQGKTDIACRKTTENV